MSILDEIDETLTDWRGSKDAMRWTPPAPQPTAEQLASVVEMFRAAIVPAFQQLARQVNAAFASMAPLIALLAEPRPSALDARYRQRQRNRRKRR